MSRKEFVCLSLQHDVYGTDPLYQALDNECLEMKAQSLKSRLTPKIMKKQKSSVEHYYCAVEALLRDQTRIMFQLGIMFNKRFYRRDIGLELFVSRYGSDGRLFAGVKETFPKLCETFPDPKPTDELIAINGKTFPLRPSLSFFTQLDDYISTAPRPLILTFIQGQNRDCAFLEQVARQNQEAAIAKLTARKAPGPQRTSISFDVAIPGTNLEADTPDVMSIRREDEIHFQYSQSQDEYSGDELTPPSLDGKRTLVSDDTFIVCIGDADDANADAGSESTFACLGVQTKSRLSILASTYDYDLACRSIDAMSELASTPRSANMQRRATIPVALRSANISSTRADLIEITSPPPGGARRRGRHGAHRAMLSNRTNDHYATFNFWLYQESSAHKWCEVSVLGHHVAAKDKRAVMGLKDHAWVIATFLQEILDKWWSQISPWDQGGMRKLAAQFNTLIREGLSVDEINAFFVSHFEYAQRRFTGWLQGSVTSPPLMGEFDPQLVALYKVKIRDAQMRIQIGMVRMICIIPYLFYHSISCIILDMVILKSIIGDIRASCNLDHFVIWTMGRATRWSASEGCLAAGSWSPSARSPMKKKQKSITDGPAAALGAARRGAKLVIEPRGAYNATSKLHDFDGETTGRLPGRTRPRASVSSQMRGVPRGWWLGGSCGFVLQLRYVDPKVDVFLVQIARSADTGKYHAYIKGYH
ncbi:hypothetical protein AURANDRAFT_68176 [Aureococcus anophagefferens]|uniref:Uncharacterized protein n=1 Tax=Aureococcus anophagefferens TaxID=44056 RepID=F0YNR5_AURAN|nr:hypothetical protein AURANDRAFT_68176 [Aureococcus anophagefferens]EGB03231.1 hypothetical protein AURANDRAFT_68176 [Aureococcus anophagefferens]|eukprot:XP_009042056.1 hypothetical protein AURANDRAFT_68176 [Aureococcus anophagefferens]